MIKVVALIGKAGSGKDRILKEVLSADERRKFHEIVSCTTRPKRQNEVDGKNYHFLSVQEFLEADLLEESYFNGWYYGTPRASLNPDKVNIGVFNPDGIWNLLEEKDIDLKVYYICASNKTRLLRQLNRENNPNVHEIMRRFNTDEEDFCLLGFDVVSVTNETTKDLQDIVAVVGDSF